MPTLSDEEYVAARRALRDKLLRLTLWKVRGMRRRVASSRRARRLPKDARTLKSLLAELRELGLAPPPKPQPGPRPRSRSEPRRKRRHRDRRAT
jgi:hypothetical protein